MTDRPEKPYPAYDNPWPTVDELRPFLGSHWAVCRATPASLTRYGRCITRKQFVEAQAKALARRPQ
jgi:predicted amidohydrolase YtcJ